MGACLVFGAAEQLPLGKIIRGPEMFTRNGSTSPKASGEPQRLDAMRLQPVSSPTTARSPSEPPPAPHYQSHSETVIPTGPANDGSGSGISIIGQDLTIIGQGLRIISKGKIRVEGEVQGDVLGTEFIIGDVGKVTGVVSAETITVFGSIMGTIRGIRVMLESGAKVEGDVHHQTLSVDEGAQLEGRVRRAQNADELRPDLSEGPAAS
jgi:cytoskeletal protein CcmA (bactofilin family)